MGHGGNVGGYTKIIRKNPTITAGAYSANDVVGGEMTLSNAMRVPNGTGVLQSLWVHDEDNEAVELVFYFFQSAPANADADNDAWTWQAGDEDIFLGKVTVAAADYVAAGGDSFAMLRNVGLPLQSAGNSRDIYLYTVTTGTPNYAATTNLTYGFGILLD